MATWTDTDSAIKHFKQAWLWTDAGSKGKTLQTGMSLLELMQIQWWNTWTLPNYARLLSSKAQGCKQFWKPSKPWHVGIHKIALTEDSQMNIPMSQGFSHFSAFLHYFVLATFKPRLNRQGCKLTVWHRVSVIIILTLWQMLFSLSQCGVVNIPTNPFRNRIMVSMDERRDERQRSRMRATLLLLLLFWQTQLRTQRRRRYWVI